MAMLAEPRRKQRIGPNPRGKFFTDDDDNRGRQMLLKMGWKTGDGLGVTSQGMSQPIKPKIHTDARGLGYDRKQDPWVAHNDEFEQLLKNLNAASDTDTAGSATGDVLTHENTNALEKISKSSRSRIHYHKFVKNKDLSRASSKDMSCIFGKSINDIDETAAAQPVEVDSALDSNELANQNFVDLLEEPNHKKNKKKKKKSKHNRSHEMADDDTNPDAEVTNVLPVESESPACEEQLDYNTEVNSDRKERKRRKKRKEKESGEDIGITSTNEDMVEVSEQDNCGTSISADPTYSEEAKPKKKKSKKRKRENDCEADEIVPAEENIQVVSSFDEPITDTSDTLSSEPILSKKKKKKKNKRIVEVDEPNEVLPLEENTIATNEPVLTPPNALAPQNEKIESFGSMQFINRGSIDDYFKNKRLQMLQKTLGK